jgi:hypothetical protein
MSAYRLLQEGKKAYGEHVKIVGVAPASHQWQQRLGGVRQVSNILHYELFHLDVGTLVPLRGLLERIEAPSGLFANEENDRGAAATQYEERLEVLQARNTGACNDSGVGVDSGGRNRELEVWMSPSQDDGDGRMRRTSCLIEIMLVEISAILLTETAVSLDWRGVSARRRREREEEEEEGNHIPC